LVERGYHLGSREAGRSVKEVGSMDDSEFLKLLTHIHDEMLDVVKEQHPTHEQFAAWLLGQIEGRLRMRIGTVKT
jgi:hypothetical protein